MSKFALHFAQCAVVPHICNEETMQQQRRKQTRTYMITAEDMNQLRAYARIDGALTGLIWIVSFGLFIGGLETPLMGTLSLMAGVASLIYAAMRLKRYRDEALDGIMSFRRGFAYSALTYFYASWIMAFGQFIYFQFIDNGYMLSHYTMIVTDGEFSDMMKQLYGISKEDMKLAMDTVSSLRPIEIAFQFLTSNILLGLFVSLPVAALMSSKVKRRY